MAEQYILLVEDDEDDAELTLLAFKRARISNPIFRVPDGFQALDWLLCRGTYETRSPSDLPAIILLDLNLPRMSGNEVLQAIRAHDQLKHLPVVILTSSDEERDLAMAYANHANSYVRKPIDHGQFAEAARHLGLYWLVLNVAPPPSRTIDT